MILPWLLYAVPFIIKEFNLLNLGLKLRWIYIYIYIYIYISFYDLGDSYFSRSICDSGTVEIIGPIASTVEDVMLV